MPALSDKDKRKLEGLDLPPNVKPVVRKIWEENQEGGKAGAFAYVVLTVSVIAVLLLNLRYPQLEPFADFAIVVIWPFSLFHLAMALLMASVASSLLKSINEKSKTFYLSRGNLGLSKDRFSKKRFFVLSFQATVAVVLILAKAPVTAFVWITGIVSIRWAIGVLSERTARFLLLLEESMVCVDKDGGPRMTGRSIEGQYIRLYWSDSFRPASTWNARRNFRSEKPPAKCRGFSFACAT